MYIIIHDCNMDMAYASVLYHPLQQHGYGVRKFTLSSISATWLWRMQVYIMINYSNMVMAYASLHYHPLQQHGYGLGKFHP